MGTKRWTSYTKWICKYTIKQCNSTHRIYWCGLSQRLVHTYIHTICNIYILPCSFFVVAVVVACSYKYTYTYTYYSICVKAFKPQTQEVKRKRSQCVDFKWLLNSGRKFDMNPTEFHSHEFWANWITYSGKFKRTMKCSYIKYREFLFE